MKKIFEFIMGVVCLIGGVLWLIDFDNSDGIKSFLCLSLSLVCFYAALKWLKLDEI